MTKGKVAGGLTIREAMLRSRKPMRPTWAMGRDLDWLIRQARAALRDAIAKHKPIFNRQLNALLEAKAASKRHEWPVIVPHFVTFDYRTFTDIDVVVEEKNRAERLSKRKNAKRK